jgi:hypothetical protein
MSELVTAPATPAAVVDAVPVVAPVTVDPTASKADQKAAILAGHAKAKLAEAVAADIAKPDTAKDEPKTDATKPEAKKPEAKDRSVATIAKQSQEIRDLRAKLASFEGKTPGQTKADFIAEIKANPGLLFKEIDDPELLTKLGAARFAELDPEAKLKAEVMTEVDALKKQLADKETEAKTAAEKAADANAYSTVAIALKDGYVMTDAGKVEIDTSNLVLCKRLTETGHRDIPREALTIAQGLLRAIKGATQANVVTALKVAYDTIENSERERAQLYRLEEAPKTTTVKPPKTIGAPKTITSRHGSGGTSPPIKPQSKAEAKAAILAQHARNRRLETLAAA